MSFRSIVAGSLVLSVGLGVFAACKREQPEGAKIDATAIERCERGIERAVLQTETRQSMKTYYGECAGIYTEQGCRQAYQDAANLDPSQQMAKVLEGCRAAYCPSFANQEFEACKPDFKPASPAVIMKAWPPLHEAILERDLRAYAPRVSRAMLVFYSRVMQRMGGAMAPPPASGAAEADGSAPSAADAGAASEATAADAGAANAAADAGKGAASAQARKGAASAPSP
ncbi:MAG TPA: hypothetical protein VI072_26105 [Polyangiaceae bacterium]